MFIILHMYTKNLNHLMYASWDMECGRHNLCTINEHYMMYGSIIWYGAWQTEFCFHFGPFFALLSPPPPNNQENQNFEKIKKCLKILSFYTYVPQMTIWYMVLEIWSSTEFFVILDHFLPFYPYQTRKSKFWKNEKMPGDIFISHLLTINENHMMYGSWDMKHNR